MHREEQICRLYQVVRRDRWGVADAGFGKAKGNLLLGIVKPALFLKETRQREARIHATGIRGLQGT